MRQSGRCSVSHGGHFVVWLPIMSGNVAPLHYMSPCDATMCTYICVHTIYGVVIFGLIVKHTLHWRTRVNSRGGDIIKSVAVPITERPYCVLPSLESKLQSTQFSTWNLQFPQGAGHREVTQRGTLVLKFLCQYLKCFFFLWFTDNLPKIMFCWRTCIYSSHLLNSLQWFLFLIIRNKEALKSYWKRFGPFSRPFFVFLDSPREDGSRGRFGNVVTALYPHWPASLCIHTRWLLSPVIPYF